MKSLTKYLQEALDLKNSNFNQTQYQRRQELTLITENTKAQRYAIQIIIQSTETLLVEHELYNKFSKTNNLWRRDPEDLNIPVKGHYHIVANKSKMEIYAVNMDGTAHHRRNKGYEVPKKEADELRKFGVQIPANRIIECVNLIINEELENRSVSFVIVIEG